MKFLRFVGDEIVLGTLVAFLSVLTAPAGYQGAVAGGKQNDYEILGMKNLNDGNAEYFEPTRISPRTVTTSTTGT